MKVEGAGVFERSSDHAKGRPNRSLTRSVKTLRFSTSSLLYSRLDDPRLLSPDLSSADGETGTLPVRRSVSSVLTQPAGDRAGCQAVSAPRAPFTEVAFTAGFRSIRRFNTVMRTSYGRTPRELRCQQHATPAVAPGCVTLKLPSGHLTSDPRSCSISHRKSHQALRR